MSVSPMVMARLRLRLHVATRRIRRRGAVQGAMQLDPGKLRLCPLFSTWSLSALSDLLHGTVQEVYCKGEVIVYNGEPLKSSSLFWIALGRFAEVPSKSEKLIVGHPEPDTSVSSSRSTSCRVHAYIPTTENHSDDFMTFRAGQLAAGERLFLGVSYRRTIRCESAATVFRIPFDTIMRIQKKCDVSLEATVAAAKDIVKGQMLRANEKPPLRFALLQNPLLRGLDASTQSILWLRLFPAVACAQETFCRDVFTSDTIFFLQSGGVRVGGIRGSPWNEIVSRGSSFGLESFVPYDIPHFYGERRPATATSFCQLWSIKMTAVLETITESEWKRCAEIAQKTIKLRVCRVNLRKVPLFSHLHESVIAAIEKRMQMRVVRPGECILVPKKIPQEAIVVLVGATYYASEMCGGETPITSEVVKTPVSCGDQVAFAECIAQRPLKHGLYAATGALIFSVTRSAIMGSLQDCETVVIGAAMAHLDGPRTHCYTQRVVNKAQEEALRRVKKHAHNQRNEVASLYNEDHYCHPPDADVGQVVKVHTQVLSTLTMQMTSLRFGVMATGQNTHQYDVAAHSAMRAPPNVASRNSHHPHSCFTLDEKGRVQYCSEGVVPEKKPTGGEQSIDVVSQTKEGRGAGEIMLPECLAVKEGFARRLNEVPRSSALRCVPGVKVAAVASHSPASHRVMALRREGDKLQNVVDNAFSLPFNYISPRPRRRNSAYATM
ncbi:hypothetical protein DQ04_01441050 [Trypanosoma grayi]|uniref:hypothetical protein n=1 Tax=Trypanosoma grayi TaxID=71804 RepID=UPI0004F40291|nr:hypothetical protein DQ04_01441050 [Trypanosoma grayi]KEG12759.1 hypothetical protein DQ04_01441050 [Trypanosoma grayi]